MLDSHQALESFYAAASASLSSRHTLGYRSACRTVSELEEKTTHTPDEDTFCLEFVV